MSKPKFEIPVAPEAIIAMAREATWAKQDVPETKHLRSPKFFVGSFPNDGRGPRSLVVCDFDIEDQGFPPGTRGTDGALRVGAAVQHLSREQSKEVFLIALSRWLGRFGAGTGG